MCVIIDNSIVGDFIKNNKNTVPLKEWLDQGEGKLIIPPSGTDLHKEYKRKFNRKFVRGILKGYRDKGVAITISASAAEEVKNLSDDLKTQLKSNDSHIIALAIVSRAKLLASNDEKLGEDFKKHISKGKVYKYAMHESLLNQNTCPL